MNAPLSWDQIATLWINQHHNVVLDWLLMPVSWFAEGGVGWIAIIVLLLIFGHRRERLLTLVFLGGLLITEFVIMPQIRAHYFRPRPYMYMEGIRQLGHRWENTSFPSGHAHLWAQATLLYGLAYRRWLGPLIGLSLITFYSRPYAGMHHLLDVVAGAGLGGVMGLLEVAVASKLGLLRTPTAAARETAPPPPASG